MEIVASSRIISCIHQCPVQTSSKEEVYENTFNISAKCVDEFDQNGENSATGIDMHFYD